MKMFYNHEKMLIQYTLKTDPPEAMYWTTYRLKVTDIKILTKLDKQTTAKIRKDIFNDIISNEPNPTTNKNQISKKRKAAEPEHVKTRQTKRQARG